MPQRSIPFPITPVDLQPGTRSIARGDFAGGHVLGRPWICINPSENAREPRNRKSRIGLCLCLCAYSASRVFPAREGQAWHRFTTRVGGTKGGSSEPSGTSRGRGIYGGPMVVEFLVLFMGRCTADDRLEICLFQRRMVYTWLTLWNRILPSGGCVLSRNEGCLDPSKYRARVEFLVRGVELWARLGRSWFGEVSESEDVELALKWGIGFERGLKRL